MQQVAPETAKTAVLVPGLPRSLIAQLDTIAVRHERSRSAEIRHLIREYVDQQSPQEPQPA